MPRPTRNDHARQQFGRRARHFREQLGLSQEALAEKADIHRTYISGAERGQRNLSLDIIIRLADALEVPASTLFQDWD